MKIAFIKLQILKEVVVARINKTAYIEKQKRQPLHLQVDDKKSGKSPKKLKQIAWATVHKMTGGTGRSIRRKDHSTHLNYMH